MAEKSSTQSQQKSTIDPLGAFAGMFPGMEAYKRMGEENLARFNDYLRDMVKAEEVVFEQAEKNMDQAAELANEAFRNSVKVAGEWRKLTLEMAKRAVNY